MLEFRGPAYSKKPVEQILKSGNDFVIAVKGNQRKLQQHLQTQFEQQDPDSIEVHTEQVRDRRTQRTVSVLAAGESLDAAWSGVKSLIRVERVGSRGSEMIQETIFYISSLTEDAAQFCQRIRDHWQIENPLAELGQRCGVERRCGSDGFRTCARDHGNPADDSGQSAAIE